MANKVKVINFNDSLTTTENPTLKSLEALTAVNASECVTKSQMETYVGVSAYMVLANIAAIKALVNPSDKTVKIAQSEKSLFVFKLGDTSTADDIHILQDVNNTGRWFREEKIDLTNDQSIDGIKTFTSFPKKSGSASALNPTLDAQLATKYYCDNTFATAGEAVGTAVGLHEAQQNITELALNQEYGEFQGENGLYTELFLNHDNEDKTIETSSNSLAKINADLRGAPFYELGLSSISDFFQNDRESSLTPKAGLLKPNEKVYYGKSIDSWKTDKFMTANYALSWDDTLKAWWCVSGEGRIIKISEDFSESLGWWAVSNKSFLFGLCKVGDYLYVSDITYSTNGRVTKHLVDSNGNLGSLPSGSTISDSLAISGDGTNYTYPVDIASDGSYLYVVCRTTNKIGKINITGGSFTGWDSNFSIAAYGTTQKFHGIAYNSIDDKLYIANVTDATITKIEKDGTKGYNKIIGASDVWQSMDFKNGDIYGVHYISGVLIQKLAIKNTETLKGQITGVYKNALIEAYGDICSTVYGGNRYYFAVNQNTRLIRVYNDSFVEVTSGTPQSTTLGDGSGQGITAFTGIASDGTYIYLSASGSTNNCIIRINITDLDGSYSLTGVGSDIKAQLGLTINPLGFDLIPSESGKYVYYDASTTSVRQGDITVNSAGTIIFERPAIIGANLTSLRFNPNDSRQLFLSRQTGSYPTTIIDFPMSRYMGDGNQPYIIDLIKNLDGGGFGFDATGDFWKADYSTPYNFHKIAIASASDKEVTGKGKRRVRYYGGTYPQTGYLKSYPSVTYFAGDVKKAIGYKRKNDASLYSSANNVLPLKGKYIMSNYGFSIIDDEANTEFMVFNRCESVGNYNGIDAASGIPTFSDIEIVNDIVFLSSDQGAFAIDFVNDKIYNVSTNGIWLYQFGIKDRNLATNSFATSWGAASINTACVVGSTTIKNISVKQDTAINTDEHNGSETSIDNSEIYIGVGHSTGSNLIKWKSGVSFAQTASAPSCYVKISDSWNWHEIYNYQNDSGIYQIVVGDIRKVYANASSVQWNIQTGGFWRQYTTASTPAIANNYINSLDIKTIYRNGLAYDYAVIGMGKAVSTTFAIQVADITNNKIETVLQYNSNATGANGVAWAKNNTIYAACVDGASATNLYVCERKDFLTLTSINCLWAIKNITSLNYEYYQLLDDIKNVTFANNTLCIANDKGCQIIELPNQDSIYETKTFSIEQANKMFYIANDSRGLPQNSGKIRQRNIFSDVLATKYTFTNGSVNSWDYDASTPSYFGCNYEWVLGQSGGGTQPKVSWNTVDKCTEIIIYVVRNSNAGKIDILVTDSSGNKSIIYDTFASEEVRQDQIIIKGLTSEIHTVTLTCRSDKNALSSDYYFKFQGCVEISETSDDRGNVTIKYHFSPDQDKATKHFNQLTTEGTEEYISSQQLFSGTGSELNFQLPATNLGADIILVEVYNGAIWVSKTKDTDYSYDTPVSGQQTITFVSPPASGTDNIRVTLIRQGTLGKIRAEFDYGANATGLEEAYVNDLGVYITKL